MSTQVNITGFSGTTPFYIYVCDSGFTSCFYVDSGSTTPKSVIIPAPYDTLQSFGMKIIDDNNCETTNIIIP